jgi:hypothetical protein
MRIKGSLMRIKEILMRIKESLIRIKEILICIKGSLIRIKEILICIKGSLIRIKEILICIKGSLIRLKGSLIRIDRLQIDVVRAIDGERERQQPRTNVAVAGLALSIILMIAPAILLPLLCLATR